MKKFLMLTLTMFSLSSQAQIWTELPIRRVCVCYENIYNYSVTLTVKYINLRGAVTSQQNLESWNHSEWSDDAERAMRECAEESKVHPQCKSFI